jgi:hypothetical protein
MELLESFDDCDALSEPAAKPAARRPPTSFSYPLIAPSLCATDMAALRYVRGRARFHRRLSSQYFACNSGH